MTMTSLPGNPHDVVNFDDVVTARARLVGVIRPTPSRLADAISRAVGRAVILKPEHIQRTGSFKIRGAYNCISQLPPGAAVVAASAGNHAQGVALASRLTHRSATIFMPDNASLPKMQATQDYGATVLFGGPTLDDCLDAARNLAADTGAIFVPPFDHPHVIAGQGTVGLEIADEVREPAVVLVPIGGGGLISGTALALAAVRQDLPVVGIEAEGAASMRRSLDLGTLTRLPSVATMADGIALKAPSELTLALTRRYVTDVVTVTEEEISQAVLLLLERAKAVVEPSGAVGLAAVMAGKVAGNGPVVVVVSGGNVDPLLLTHIVQHGLSAAGRYLRLRVVFADRPGSLAALTAEVARLGLNVLDVDHHRTGAGLGIDQVEVELTVETRNPGHSAEVQEALAAQGFTATLR